MLSGYLFIFHETYLIYKVIDDKTAIIYMIYRVTRIDWIFKANTQ